MKLQKVYNTGHYSKKIYIGEYSAKFNTNNLMLWLHQNDWHFRFKCENGHFSEKISIYVYSAKLNTNISTLWLHKNDCSYNFSIKQGIIRRKFILRNSLLNSISIFECNDCTKMIPDTIFL